MTAVKCEFPDARHQVRRKWSFSARSPVEEPECPNLLSTGPESCLRSLTTAIMPRGQKSKVRAREKRHQARSETQGLHDQATTSRGEETTSSSPPDSESAPSSSSAAGTPKGPQGAQGTTSAAAGAIPKRSGGGGAARSRSGVGAEGQVQGGENSSQASAAAASSHTDLLTKKAQMLVQHMLCKYKKRELIKKSEMLKAISGRYMKQFPEILSRASEHMEVVFGLVLKEVRPNSQCYTLVSNLDFSDSESMRGDLGLPKNGLLMPLLSFIYLNGPRISEEHIWKFLNILGIYDGRRHFIFGDTRKLITEDLVREEYLEYRQVPGSNPPRCEFLWGPKALTETNKNKVMEFLAKVNDTVPDAFLAQYEESFRQEVESTGARAAARVGISALGMAATSASCMAATSASGMAATSASGMAATSASGMAATSASGMAATSASGMAATSASGMAATSASGMAGMSAWVTAGMSASVWDGPSAAAQAQYLASARPGISTAASAGPSASASAHAGAVSSHSSRP
ncbi:melanoma-associated antigen B2 isoform X2 [Bubalus bubalis]|uniref:melanoma-associated antigen B2 isoform X2 n=2 Tax=Bubalus bubalis TaxID=89462 RepID=UPI001E1B7D76|nr:melanoma-associated antigen B2 isoform X2 [Bubalus bubalis]